MPTSTKDSASDIDFVEIKKDMTDTALISNDELSIRKRRRVGVDVEIAREILRQI